jgi:hypothetical protein
MILVIWKFEIWILGFYRGLKIFRGVPGVHKQEGLDG